MPILPIIDLLIVSGWTALMVGAALKAIDMTTRYQPAIAGLSPLDFAVIAAVCFGFALTLAARTWVRLNEPALLALKRRQMQEEGRRRALALEEDAQAQFEEGEARRVARVAGEDRG